MRAAINFWEIKFRGDPLLLMTLRYLTSFTFSRGSFIVIQSHFSEEKISFFEIKFYRKIGLQNGFLHWGFRHTVRSVTQHRMMLWLRVGRPISLYAKVENMLLLHENLNVIIIASLFQSALTLYVIVTFLKIWLEAILKFSIIALSL